MAPPAIFTGDFETPLKKSIDFYMICSLLLAIGASQAPAVTVH
jgi:hypothetical protein